MASYLGKISAIVSANTAGYVRSLNDAAAQTRDFAKTIRSDITRSSNDASKAFNSILSPLQKLQRALDAASSQRLSFKGVEGAINNVKQLRQQINEIRDLQLAVRITGASGIDDLRENLLSLSSTDIQAAVRVTGSEDVEQLQRRLNRFSDRTVNLLARSAGVENIDQLAEKVDSLSDRELRLSVRAINENAIERAKRQLEQLTSASAEIATPLAAANRQLTGFAAEIQAALLPGFSQVQKAALQLEQDIRSGAEIGEERYTRLRDTVERTARAVAAVGELDLGSGAAIQQFQQQLQAVNETAIEIAGRQLQIEIGSEEVASVRDEISRLQEELTGVRSGETRLRVSAEEAVEAKRAIDRLAASRDEIQVRVEADASELQRIDEEIESLSSTIEVNVETEGASEARQQLESLRQQRVEIEARVTADRDGLTAVTAELDQAKQRLEAAPAEVRLAADFVDLTRQINEAKQQIRDLANNRVGVELDAAEALAEINLLEDLIRSLEGRRATIRASFDDDARREAEAFQADIDRLEAREVEIQASIEVNDEDLQRGLRLLEQAQRAVEQQQFDRQAVADSRARRAAEAEETERLAKALARLREQSDFVITGRVQNFDQVRQELGTILSQIGRLDATDRVQFDLDIGTLNRILSEGEVDDLATAQTILDRINAAIGERRTLDLDAETAQREADQLAATIDRLRANADFAITGRPQNLDQVQSELQRILGTIDKLNDGQRADLRVSAVVDAINAQDFEDAARALADLKRQVETGAEFNINAEQAKKAAEDVRNRIMAIDDRIEFTITGRVQNFDQARQELSAVLGDVSRLEQAQREAFSQRLQSAGEIIESAEIGKLDQAANILQEIRSELAGIKGSPVRDLLGASLDDPIRQVDVLKGGINSLQGQLDNLPAPIRQRFLPELRRLRDQFTQAEKSPQRFGQELENAADDVRRLSAEVRRISQAQGLGSFADNLDDTALRGAIGNLQALQQILNRIGATAGSDGARQFDRLRAAIQRATNAGTIGSQAFQDELEEITQDAAAAAAATGRIGQAAAFREIQRGGDIARGGFDKFSLAAQQAAFAIDDFFSATGDFTQKIRAVQNNVTQLAFILGDTTGLFIGLGAAIAAQAAVALFKWANGSVEAEDKTQALNDALARQKSLVEELKQAFDSLGDSLTRGIFSDQVKQSRDLSRQLDEIRQRSQELRREQAAALDLRVNQERGLQASLRARLESETDAGARIGLERRIELSRQRESDFAEQAQNRNFLPEDVAASVIEGLRRQFSAREGDLRVDAGPQAGVSIFPGAQSDVFSNIRDEVQQERQRQEERLAEQIAQAGGDPLELAAVLERRRDELAARADELDSSFSTTARERSAVSDQLRELQQSLQGLQAPIREALLELSLSILEGTDGIGDSLRNSRNAIENTIGGFGPLASIQSELAARFDTIVQELAAGRAAGADGRVRDDGRELTQEEIQQRKAVLERLQQEALQLESTTRSAEALEQAFRRLADQLAETVRQEAAADVERTRRAANAAEARDGTGLDDFRRVAERELAQAPQPEPLIDLAPLQARVQADLEAADTEVDRVAAELQRRVDADRQAVERVRQNLADQTERLLGFNAQERAEEAGLGGFSAPGANEIDTALAASGQLQTRSVEDVRQAFLDAGADERSVDEAIARRLQYQEDEQKWWANRGASYEEEVRRLRAAEEALDSAFSTDEEQKKFVAAYNELTSKTELGVEGASERLSEITKQFTDRLSDEQLAELVQGQFTKQQIENSGGRLQAVIDDFQLETVENFRDSLSSLDLPLDGLNEAIRKQITDSLAPGQLTPASIETIRSETGRGSRISDETKDVLSAIRDFRRFDDTSTRGFVLEESSVQSLREAGSQLRDSARELFSAEVSNERNQELATEIESIRNAIDAFDGSLESRRAIVEAADASRFDEIANAADIFLQKVRDLELERAVTAFEEQIALEGQQRIEQLDQRRQEFQRDAQERFQRDALRGNDPAGIADAIRQRDELLSVNNRTAEQESQLTQASEAIRNAFEQTAEGQQAARLADEIDIERQRQVQAREQRDAVRESAARGQDLLLRPEDLAARRGFTQFEDAQNAVLENLIGPLKEVGGDGVAAEIEDGILSLQELAQIFKRSPEIRQQLEGEIQESLANLQQARDNITGNVAAQIAQFDLERSRPSRQALQAQDINTQQGRAELNRLLRGDDANRDQPILQGIKEQTAILKLIDQRIDEVNRVVGVAGA